MWLVVAAVCSMPWVIASTASSSRPKCSPSMPARHSRRTPGKRPRLCSHQQMGRLRTPLRRHRRPRASGRSGARGAVRISSRNTVDSGRRRLRRLRAGFRDSAVLGAARWQVAHRNGAATKSAAWADSWLTLAVISIIVILLGGLRSGRGQRAQGQSVGNIHYRHDHPHRASDGHVSAHAAAGKSAGNFRAGFRAGDARDLGRTVGLADSVRGKLVHVLSAPALAILIIIYGFAASAASGLAAARSARLPEHVCEAGDDLAARARHRCPPSHPAHAAAHSLH